MNTQTSATNGATHDVDDHVVSLGADAPSNNTAADPIESSSANGAAPDPVTDWAARLRSNHAKLIEDSAVSPEVAVARGYFTATTKAELARLGFAPYQQLPPALVVPVYDVTGDIVNYQIRPDRPRVPKSKNGKPPKPLKYETVAGSRMALDVPPMARQWLGDPARPLLITEGARKADAAVSQGLCCVALLGVWNWRGKNDDGGLMALADWESIALKGRKVYITFDSDVVEKEAVQRALARLKAFLDSRGADVKIIYLPSGVGGAKVGLDDYFAAGHSVDELLALATDKLRVPETDAPEDLVSDNWTLAQLLIKLTQTNAELFRDAGGDAYLTAKDGDHSETYRLGSRDSKDWLSGLLYRETGRAASGDKISEALTVLRAIARHDSPEIELHVRVAERDGAIYLDICDRDWCQVEITETGWRIVGSAESPVRFVRAKGMLPLPVPTRGGSINELRDLLNLPTDDADNWPMIVAWLVAALKPCNAEGFDYPLLAIHGEQGSAKSSAQRILRDIVDPNKATLRAAPRDERDLAIAAAHGRVISCDNLTYISEPLSNAFCRLATGGGFATRELFTDDGEVIFDAQRPVILNGISEVVTKSDLLDRTLLTQLPVIEPARRWRKRILQQKFAAARPRILGALLDAVSAGLRRLKEGVDLEEWPRMSDFAEWVVACEKALGLDDGAFITAYRRNIGRANGLAIDASIVAQAIIGLIDECVDHTFQGTVGGLLKALDAKIEATGGQPKGKEGWPQTPEKLRAELKKLAPNLRRERIEITWGEHTRKGRALTITRLVRNQPSQPSHCHQASEINDLDRDGLCDGSQLSQTETVTPSVPVSGRNGSQSDGMTDHHTDHHTVSHSKQRAGDGVTVVTVIPVPDDPATGAARKRVRI